jgi:hypothetical protein
MRVSVLPLKPIVQRHILRLLLGATRLGRTYVDLPLWHTRGAVFVQSAPSPWTIAGRPIFLRAVSGNVGQCLDVEFVFGFISLLLTLTRQVLIEENWDTRRNTH